jgi:ribosomal protein L24E
MQKALLPRVAVIVCATLVGLAPTAAAHAAPGAVRAATPRLLPAAACWQRDYTDPAGDAEPDVTAYSLSFSCDASRFTIEFSSAPTLEWPFVLGDNFYFYASVGGGGGCAGFNRTIVAGRDSALSATVYDTPTCSRSDWSILGSADVVAVNGHTFLLGFSAAAIGGAAFSWAAASAVHVSGHNADRFPDSGQQTASGVPYYPTASSGYWLTDAGGGVHPYGNAPFDGDLVGKTLSAPIVGMASTVDHDGYWLLGRDGGVFSYGSAAFYGSTGGIHLNQPVAGMTATPTGHGYWFVASDGGIFSFGDAAFHGSTGALRLNKPIVGMAATPSGHGYWLVASDGGIFSFGDAAFHGSTGALRLNKPIVGMAPTPSGHGYWLVASDGGIFSFGDAAFHGSTGNLHLASPIVAMTTSPTGRGYRFVASDGGIFSFGDAPFFGSLAGTVAPPVISLAG